MLKITAEDFNESMLPENERWENLTLADDFLFGKIFQDLDLCLELIRIILPELNIVRITPPAVQKSIRETYDTRGVRFDLYVHDEQERIIDVEMQQADKDNLMKRARAYHSMIDLEAVGRGTMRKYDDMPEAIVIFICGFDLFKLGRHKYTFKSICVEDRELFLNDGTSTVFLNTKGKADDVSPRLKAFLDLVEGKSSDDDFVQRIESRLFEASQNLHWRQEYMLGIFQRYADMDEGRQIGEKLGLEQGLKRGEKLGLKRGEKLGLAQARTEVALRMRKAGMSDEQIQAFTDLSLEEISKL